MFKRINRENKKGFTLAELLIVVAIIGVLVAISIPIFTKQLEKARDSASISNIRAAYAEAQAAVVANAYQKGDEAITEGDVTIAKGFDFGAVSGTVTVKNVKITTQDNNEWSDLLKDEQQDFAAPDDGGEPVLAATVTFTYEDSKVTDTKYAAGS